MGDRLKMPGQRARERRHVARNGGAIYDREVAAKHLALTDGRHIYVGWHRFSGLPLCSWVIEGEDWEAMEAEIEGGLMSKFLKRLKEAVARPGNAPAATDAEWQKLYPAIVEYMTLVMDDDKQQRQTSTLLLFAEGRVWKACLGDRETELSLWASGESVAELLEALEAMLESSTPGWRSKGKRIPKKGEGGK